VEKDLKDEPVWWDDPINSEDSNSCGFYIQRLSNMGINQISADEIILEFYKNELPIAVIDAF
jgi:hypothetical protein